MKDAWNHLPGIIGDAWTRLSGTVGDAWDKLIWKSEEQPQEQFILAGGGGLIWRRMRISGRGISGQLLQFSEGIGHRRVLYRGIVQSQQLHQMSIGKARLTFGMLNEQELIELILLEAA